ncbi:hypothetical protein JCM10449v2_006769 [Rhodotorula kratochvilovae]
MAARTGNLGDDLRPADPKRQTLTRRISFPSHSLPPAHLALLRRWLVCFALVDFDIDSGPNLDNAFPPTRFPETTRHNIAFSSLPEAGALPQPDDLPDGGYAYHWRIPYPAEDNLAQVERDASGAEVARLPDADEADGALHGFVWFVRDKDDRLRRGYSQRSLVLITHLPALSGLFSALVAILGPLHFKHAQAGGARGGMVETACYNIASWPDPTPGATLELPFLGSVLTAALPLPSQAQFPLPSSAPSPLLPHSSSSARRAPATLPPTHPPSPFLTPAAWHASRQSAHLPALTGPPQLLAASLPATPLSLLLFPPGSPAAAGGAKQGEVGEVGYSKLLLLWELVLLGEPLLVWASEPRVAGEVVEALRGLIRPIPFAGDARPYFHVHDDDFARLCKPGKKPPPGLLVASTNPLLLSTCKHWPHILRLDRAPPSAPPSSSLAPSLSTGAGHAPRRSGSLSAAGAGAEDAGAGRDFGLKSARKRHVKKDEAVEREIADAWRRGDYLACDAAIYRHFAALTERFVAPLNRYFGTLWAGNEAVAARAPLLSPGPSPLPSTRFAPSAFLASLKTHGSSLPLKPSAPSLSQPGSTPTERFYARFLESPNFAKWLEGRVRATGGEVRRRYVRKLESEDWDVWARGREDGEVEEMAGRLEREVVLLEPPPAGTALSSTSSPSPSDLSIAPAGLGISTPTPAPSASLSSTRTHSPAPSSADGPGARLRAGAERLRALRDERVRSLSRGAEGREAERRGGQGR